MVEYPWGHLMGFQVANYVLFLCTKVCVVTWLVGCRYLHSRRDLIFERTYEERIDSANFRSY